MRLRRGRCWHKPPSGPSTSATTSGATTCPARCCSRLCAPRPIAASACGCCSTTTTPPGLDALLAALDAHPNIEVRLFNPFVIREPRWIGYVTDFSRLNRRMHNKSFTADNQATIIGGRNVGDEYFGATDGVLFADLDVLADRPGRHRGVEGFRSLLGERIVVSGRSVVAIGRRRSDRRARGGGVASRARSRDRRLRERAARFDIRSRVASGSAGARHGPQRA